MCFSAGVCGTVVLPDLDPSGVFPVLTVVLATLVTVVIAGAVVAYVAFPHRGEEMPGVPWLGRAMGSVRESLPTGDTPEDFYEPAGSGRGGDHRD
jgi:hypothetical protein